MIEQTMIKSALSSRNNRSAVFRKLGISEDDVTTSKKLFAQMPPPPPVTGGQFATKIERILGYSWIRIKREKALKQMGASEEEVDIENAKNLGTLGNGGRRRSFCVEDSRSNSRRNTFAVGFGGCSMRRKSRRQRFRRKSTSDLTVLKRRKSSDNVNYLSLVLAMQKQAKTTQLEIKRLKNRIKALEEK